MTNWMSDNARPRVELPWAWPERLLTGAGVLVCVASFAVIAWAWPRLPEIIPTHFGATGKPDGSGGRWIILTLPLVGTGIFASLRALANIPEQFNFPWSITADNAERQYRLARRFVLTFGVAIALIFLAIVIGTVSVALGYSTGLGRWFLATVLGGLGLLTVSLLVAGWLRR